MSSFCCAVGKNSPTIIKTIDTCQYSDNSQRIYNSQSNDIGHMHRSTH